jgi:hypothetical protein
MDTVIVFERQLQLDANDGDGALKVLRHVKSSVTPSQYFSTFQPALEWLLQSLCEYHPTQEMLITLVKAYRQKSKHALLLNAIISSFDPHLVAQNALPMCELIQEADARGFSRHHLYVSLGRVLCTKPPPRDELLQVLNAVWSELGASKSAEDYVSVAAQYLQLLLSEFGVPEVHKLLKDLLKRVSADKAYTQLSSQLQSVVVTVLQAEADKLCAIFVLEAFQKLLSLFEPAKAVEIWKNVMEAFAAVERDFTDTTLVHNLTHVARQLHDSIDHLSFEDERRQLAALISTFVRKASFGADFEAHLNFYVDCRGFFANLDAVQDTLVLGAANLAMRVRAAVKGRHTKKTSAFTKACTAYVYITIPTIADTLLRIRLLLLGAQVALANGLLPQMDAFVKAAVTTVKDEGAGDGSKEPDSNAAIREANAREETLVELLSSLCSLLISAPGHPQHGPFYLATGALNVIQGAKWRLPSSKPTLYVKMLSLFCAYGQRTLPYHVPGVDSNDTLYASEPEYVGKLDEVIGMILSQVEGSLSELVEQSDAGDVPSQKALATFSVSLFELTLSSSVMTNSTAALAAKLYGFASKLEGATVAEKAQLRGAAAHLGRLAASKGGKHADLYSRVQSLLAAQK